jgi:arylsulfatase A-like enzyme
VDFSDTYVFLLADNGTPHQVPPPNGVYNGYKLTPYEGGIRVPLLVWGPDVLPGVDPHLVQASDLPRTVLELAGSRPSVGFEDSISFRETLSGGPGLRPWAFLQRFRPNNGTSAQLDFDNWAVVRADGWKLIGKSSPFPGFPFVHSLYHLPSDPFEQSSIPVSQFPAVFEQLKAIRVEALGDAWPY